MALAGVSAVRSLASEVEADGARAPGRLAPPTRTDHMADEARGSRRAKAFDIVATGDLLLHSPILQRAHDPATGRYDFRPMFADIRPLVSRAALALCHVETPIGVGLPSTYPIFNAPPALAEAIRWTGWDACSTASNHSVDKGADGTRATRDNLDRVGVRATGTARTRAESRRILSIRVEGIRVAFLSYTYGTNGIPPPTRWSVNLISRERIRADARRARRLGADLVLVNLHWGAEYVHAPTTEQRSLARYLLKHRVVDAIVGQHAHVVQPIRRRFGRFVVYGEGNLLSAQDGESQDGLIAVLHVRAAAVGAPVIRVGYVPIWVEWPDYVVEPVAQRLRELRRRGKGRGALAQALLASYLRTVGYAGGDRFVSPSRPLSTSGPGRTLRRRPGR